MQTTLRLIALVGILACEDAAVFAPSSFLYSASRVSMGRSNTSLQVVDLKQRVGSEVRSVFSDIQSLLWFVPNATESIIDSYNLEEAAGIFAAAGRFDPGLNRNRDDERSWWMDLLQVCKDIPKMRWSCRTRYSCKYTHLWYWLDTLRSILCVWFLLQGMISVWVSGKCV